MCGYVFVDDFPDFRFGKIEDGLRGQTRFSSFAGTLLKQGRCVDCLSFPAASNRLVRDKSAEALAANDDAFVLEILVRAFDGNHADEEVFGHSPKGR